MLKTPLKLDGWVDDETDEREVIVRDSDGNVLLALSNANGQVQKSMRLTFEQITEIVDSMNAIHNAKIAFEQPQIEVAQ